MYPPAIKRGNGQWPINWVIFPALLGRAADPSVRDIDDFPTLSHVELYLSHGMIYTGNYVSIQKIPVGFSYICWYVQWFKMDYIHPSWGVVVNPGNSQCSRIPSIPPWTHEINRWIWVMFPENIWTMDMDPTAMGVSIGFHFNRASSSHK